jgi:hypothetical protein
VHTPDAANVPAGTAAKVTDPVGAVAVPLPVSSTVAVHVISRLAEVRAGGHATAARVGRSTATVVSPTLFLSDLSPA